MSLAHALRVATAGWTQLALAEATGIRQERISRILTGRRNARPTLEQIATIEDAVEKPRGFVLALAGYATVEGAVAAGAILDDSVGIITSGIEISKIGDVVRIHRIDSEQLAAARSGRPTDPPEGSDHAGETPLEPPPGA